MNYEFRFPKEKKYLLIPEMPTPNGRMHLGHIAGPYLKMDVLRRKVERGNGVAYTVSGSDAYESYVELKAEQLNMETEDICNRFHGMIRKDFEALNIHFHLFINPLEEKWRQRFFDREKELMQMLIDAGVVVEREETFQYDPKKKRFLNGCWIRGSCPCCGSPTGSYLCETCGTHYRPSDIFDPANYPHALEVHGSALYLRLDPPLLFAKLEKMNIDRSFCHILENYIELQGPYIRLTTPQATGVEWNLGSGKQVLFTYSALLFFSIFCADICKEEFDLAHHPFAKDGDFETIASFGIDNAVPYLAGVLMGGMGLPPYKAFDNYFSNYFYFLNEEKFSTSRVHVIWGSDIVNISNVQSDAVRYYLTKQNPAFEKKNFDVNHFIDTVNRDLFGRYNAVIKEALSLVSGSTDCEMLKQVFGRLESLADQQNKSLDPVKFDLGQVLAPVEEWIGIFETWGCPEKAKYGYWWLKGFSFLSYPVMPEISIKLWKMLSDTPAITANNFFYDLKIPGDEPMDLLFRKVDVAELEKCLPDNFKTLNNIK